MLRLVLEWSSTNGAASKDSLLVRYIKYMEKEPIKKQEAKLWQPVGPKYVIEKIDNFFVKVGQKMKMNETEVEFTAIMRPPGVRMIVITPENKIRLSYEYRYENESWGYRLPGGKVFDEVEGYLPVYESGADIAEEVVNACKREGLEESGISFEKVNPIEVLKNGAKVEWDLHLVLVDSYKDAGEQNLEEGEAVEVYEFTPQEVLDLIDAGEYGEDRTAIPLRKFILENFINKDR